MIYHMFDVDPNWPETRELDSELTLTSSLPPLRHPVLVISNLSSWITPKRIFIVNNHPSLMLISSMYYPTAIPLISQS